MGSSFIILTLICFLLALWTYTPPKEGDGTKENDIISGKEGANHDGNLNRMISSGSQLAIVPNETLPESDNEARNDKQSKVYHATHV